MSKIIEFYRGKPFVHPKGFTIDYIWGWDRDVLEQQHDYIQWLFPLATKSASIARSPVLTPEEIAEFRGSDELKERLLESFSIMLEFYGLIMTEDGEITIAPSFTYTSDRWISSGNHNYKRISRIIKSLMLLGLEEYAAAFHGILLSIYEDYPEEIGKNTLEHWNRSVSPEN
jgi:hypothetical protein